MVKPGNTTFIHFGLILIAFISIPALCQEDVCLTEDTIADYAVTLRQTHIYESLEVYAEILDEAAPKSVFPLIELVEDQYGIIWARVNLADGKEGYVTDIVALRKSRTELAQVLGLIDDAEFESWDQEQVDEVQGLEPETGMSDKQLLLSYGEPLEKRTIDNWEEYVYPRKRILLADGVITGITEIVNLPRDKNIEIQFRAEDEELTRLGGRWSEIQTAQGSYWIDMDGTGTGRYRFSIPYTGTYRLSAEWYVTEENAPVVHYKLRTREDAFACFQGNQRLHGNREVLLGLAELDAEERYILEVTAQDNMPFSIGRIKITFENLTTNE